MCQIHRHGFLHCKCSFTDGNVIPCDVDSQGPYCNKFVTETCFLLDTRIGNTDYLSLDKVPSENVRYHPNHYQCKITDDVVVDPPHENCPLCGPKGDPQIQASLGTAEGGFQAQSDWLGWLLEGPQKDGDKRTG